VSAELRGQHLHFEPTSGIAGDMAVAALVDAGVPAQVVTEAVAATGVPALRTRFERRQRGAYVGRGFVVSFPGSREHEHHDHDHDHDHGEHEHHHHDHDHGEHEHHHDHAHAGGKAPAHAHHTHAEIRRLLQRASLTPDARALALEIFARLADVEAALHGTSPARVAFHEVGAYDSIADIVGVSAAIAWLEPSAISSGPVVVGTGRVRIAHGVVPVPAPATAELLRGIPAAFEGHGELTTPTGAAILATVVDTFGPPPPMRTRAVGYGAGTRELPDRPNVLRALVGEPLGRAAAAAAPDVVVVEANIDDMSPLLVAPLFDALFAAGALDVWSTPILMKKGRPAIQVSAMAPPADLAAVQAAFFRGSTTLGLRVHAADRAVLARSFAEVDTPYGRVRVKLAAAAGGEVIGAQPEFDDCRRRAAASGASVREVLSAASAAARALLAAPRAAGAAKRKTAQKKKTTKTTKKTARKAGR
jgi:uncharacterized protein (TIGR00299 family) protein